MLKKILRKLYQKTEKNFLIIKDLRDALANCEQEKIEEILDKNPAIINAKDDFGQTPLDYALSLPSVFYPKKIIDILLQKNADPFLLSNNILDSKSKDKINAFEIAIKKSRLDLVKLFIDKKIISNEILNRKNKDGITPLHLASMNGDHNMILFLLNLGADPKIKTSKDFTALHFASEKGFLDNDIFAVFLNKEIEIDAENQEKITPLQIAVSNGCPITAQTLLENGAKAHRFNNNGETLLHIATKNGHLEMIKMLLNHVIIPNHKNNDGLTALNIADQNKFTEIANILKLNKLLCEAVIKGNADLVRKILSKKDANPNSNFDDENSENFTSSNQKNKPILKRNPLIKISAENGNLEIVKILLENGAFLDDNFIKNIKSEKNEYKKEIKDTLLETLELYGATKENNFDKVKKLLEKNIPLNAKFDKEKRTALSFAVANNYFAIARLLLNAGADVNTREELYQETPLHLSTNQNNQKMTELLLGVNEIDVNVCDWAGFTPLHFATNNDNLDLTLLLLKKGANAELQDIKNQHTPLHIATIKGNLEIVKALLTQVVWSNSAINAFDSKQRTAIYFATKNLISNIAIPENYLKIIEILLEAEANPDLKGANFKKSPRNILAENSFEILRKKISKIEKIPANSSEFTKLEAVA